MIEVSISAGDLVVERRSPLSIKFANISRGPCFDIVFWLKLPAGIMLAAGSDRVEIPVIAAGRTHTHEVMVAPRRPGVFELTSRSFSYRDGLDRPVRVTDFRARVVATAAPPPPPPVPQPVGRLRVECESGPLELGAWDELRILVTNGTGVRLHDVTVALEGPFDSDGRRPRIQVLEDGKTARFPFRVNAAQGGHHVPVTVHTTYSHQDGGGAFRPRTQRDTLTIVVRAAAHSKPAVQTILYLAASPRDLPRLRWDEEMREVKERLQLARQRDQYRIESFVAVRFNDISQALMDHQPQAVHFSGHGARNGDLYFEDRNGNSTSIRPEGLAALFGQHRSTLRCVILSACYSVRLAEAVAAQIDHVVGMRYPILDEAAIEFSVGFYIGLFGGQSVPDAFDRGRSTIQAQETIGSDHLTPVIFPPGP